MNSKGIRKFTQKECPLLLLVVEKRGGGQGVYERASELPNLNKLGDRHRDILEPLLAIALIGDLQEGKGSNLHDTLRQLALEMEGKKEEREKASEAIPAAVEVIRNLVGTRDTLFISDTDLMVEMKNKEDSLGFLETTASLARFMKKLEVYCKPTRTDQGVQRGYTFEGCQVEDLVKRYGLKRKGSEK